uniref:3'-5' exonuclease n=1 Tax=Cuerna arida TaxID=1464854 RepID=A0A1B6H293_9HEMI
MEERKLPKWMERRTAARKKINETLDLADTQIGDEKPFLSFEGKVKYFDTMGDWGFVCEALLKQLESLEELIIGFDLEWPVNYKLGQRQGRTALIQLCFSKEMCHLLHVFEWQKLPKVFVDIISHPKVKLIGVNIRCDLWKLGRDFDISVSSIVKNNTVELSHLANKLFSTNECWSLERLVLFVLKMRLAKPEDIRLSDWTQNPMTKYQLEYAANDVYASFILYNRFKELEVKFNMKVELLR